MSPNPGIFCQKVRIPAIFRILAQERQDGNGPRIVKKRGRELSVWSISPPWRAFSCGKNGISLLKEIFGSVENGEKRGFGRLFPSKWRPSACKTPLSFCNPFPPWADAGAASVRTAFRSGRQSVAETAFRLSFRISGNSQDSHISVRSRPCVRPRDSRETGSDVLTK